MPALVPPGVVVAEAVGPSADGEGLLPEEAPLVANAVAKRRREFTAGRSCARRALRALGLPPGPILAGPNREPLWPAGVAGSITHCAGYCAAAVGWRDAVGSIGIDAETHGPLPRGVEEMVCTPAERQWVRSAPAGVEWGMVVFSAKESVYKAWFPLAGRWLGFEEAELTIDPDGGMFAVRLAPGPAAVLGPAAVSLGGRFAVGDGIVATCVVIPPPAP
jgi:enterobactin synthetase component D / holo-[acyl-carrier protein] synthase